MHKQRQPEPGDSRKPAKGRFSRYAAETERFAQKHRPRADPDLKRLKSAYAAFLDSMDRLGHDLMQDMNDVEGTMRSLAVLGLFESGKTVYAPKTVSRFMAALASMEEPECAHYPGIFLCALMERGRHAKYSIRTAALDYCMDYLGLMNTRALEVFGDSGDYLGARMQKGSILLHGSAGYCAANYMAGGLIVVEGDIGDCAGMEMSGGEMRVLGNAGSGLGHALIGGKIHLQGSVQGEGRGEESGAGNGMESGTIIIGGDSGDFAGFAMSGGELRILGDAGIGLGAQMTGGEIHVEGRIGSICDLFKGGRIYQRGKLVAGK